MERTHRHDKRHIFFSVLEFSGFLAWKTNTTLPDGSPYRYHVPDELPVLERFVEATEAAGIGHGF